jgi:hypothetical protein
MIYRLRGSKKVAGTFPRKVPATFFGFWLLIVALIFGSATGQAADSVLYRLFLQDGTSITSYGEFARVAGRVVLSIPLGEPSESPALQLISIPETSVDWLRTDRYSQAVRAKRYGETRGESDFAVLSARVTEALNQIALTSDPARRLAMAIEARGNLARWPSQNFGYRAGDVAQLVGMLDEVISELRVAAGTVEFRCQPGCQRDAPRHLRKCWLHPAFATASNKPSRPPLWSPSPQNAFHCSTP